MYGLLQEHGLQRFYELGGRATGPIGVAPRAATLDWLAEYESASTDAAGVARLALDVQGIRCAACVWLLQELWKQQPGQRAIRIDPSLGNLQLTYDAKAATAAAFLTAAARLGYPMAKASKRAPRDGGLLIRLGICAALAVNVMILAIAQYFGLQQQDGALSALFERVAMVLATASVVVGGPVFFRAAWAGLRHGMVHMDLPISLGLLLAYGGSLHGHLTGGASYFDTVAIFVALMLIGRFVQQRSLQWNRDRMLADDGAEHLRARLLADGGFAMVPVGSLRRGDEIVLAPGDLVAVELRLCDRGSSFSLDWINGESEPRAFAAGASVPAGAFHAGRAAVRASVTAGYGESGLAALLQRPALAREDAFAGSRFWQLLGRHYSLGVLLAAALGGAVWSVLDPSRAMAVVISILVVTCPCALGVASPLALHLALATLRGRGVFVRNQTLLERVRAVRKVVFDKTGTVTFGGLCAEVVKAPPPALLPVVATLAASSNHPVSQAVLQALGREAGFRADLHCEELLGQGVRTLADGHDYRLGSRRFATGGSAGQGLARQCVFGRDGEVLAVFALREDFRANAREEIAALQARGLQVHLLSGDEPARVAAAAVELGIAADLAHGGMSPRDKADHLERLDRRDTLMLGDGLNDAPAFDRAFCAGTPALDRPVLPARADFCFAGAHGGAVTQVLAVADALHATLRSNLILALGYNAATLALCFAGLATPVLCAVLMPLSSLALVANTTLRSRRCRGRLP